MAAYFIRTGGAVPPPMAPTSVVKVITTSYQIQPTDYFIFVQALPTTITLPSSSLVYSGKSFIIKDETGQASLNPIKILTSDTLDGNQTSMTLAVNYGSITFLWNGLQWATSGTNYQEDRGPYLQPSPVNKTIIQNWVSSKCATGRISFWSQTSQPAVSNLNSATASGASFFGGVAIPNGRILMVPYNYSNVGAFDPTRDGYSDMFFPTGFIPPQAFSGGVLTPQGKVVFIPYKSGNVSVYVNEGGGILSNATAHNAPLPAFLGGVLDPNGNVVMVPAQSSSNIGTYNILTNTFSNILKINSDGGFAGGVLLPNGNVVFVSNTNSNIGQFNPLSTPPSYSNSFRASGFSGGVLAPDGNVIMMGVTVSNVGVFNPASLTFSNVITGSFFNGGCLLPSGNVIMAPSTGRSNIGMFDSVSLTYSNSTPIPPGSGPFAGATIGNDGRVILVPSSGNALIISAITPTTQEFFLSPYFNKF